MTIPKAIAHRDSKPTDTDEDEILDYSPKYNGYMSVKNLYPAVAFLGDEEDYLNYSVDNYSRINEKYNFPKEIVDYSFYDNELNNVFGSVVLVGHQKKSEKLNLMPHGIYNFTVFEGFYPGFVSLKINVDEYINFENSEISGLQKTIIDFFNNKAIYEENKLRHKGASLVYGPPGNGKTTCLMNLINSPAFQGMYVIFIPKHMSFKSLENFKEHFEGHNTLIIMEEMTERLGGGTEDILNFLDGYASWNNCYVIATTNYPEVLPPNLVDRPGRFNNLVEIKAPTEEQKAFFLTKKGFSEEDIKAVLPKCKEFSLDYISQLALSAKLHKLPLVDSLTNLENNKKKVKNSFKGKSNIGL